MLKVIFLSLFLFQSCFAGELDGRYEADLSEFNGKLKEMVEMVEMSMHLDVSTDRASLTVAMGIENMNIPPSISAFDLVESKGKAELVNQNGRMTIDNKGDFILLTCVKGCEKGAVKMPSKWNRLP